MSDDLLPARAGRCVGSAAYRAEATSASPEPRGGLLAGPGHRAMGLLCPQPPASAGITADLPACTPRSPLRRSLRVGRDDTWHASCCMLERRGYVVKRGQGVPATWDPGFKASAGVFSKLPPSSADIREPVSTAHRPKSQQRAAAEHAPHRAPSDLQ
jgi:hypothetical protein